MLDDRPCSQAETSGRIGDPNDASAIVRDSYPRTKIPRTNWKTVPSQIRDQAALQGVLTRLHRPGLGLREVRAPT